MKAIGDPDQHFQCDLNPSLKFKQISGLTPAILMQRYFENSSCLLPKVGYSIAGQLHITHAGLCAFDGDGPLPVGDRQIHGGIGIEGFQSQ